MLEHWLRDRKQESGYSQISHTEVGILTEHGENRLLTGGPSVTTPTFLHGDTEIMDVVGLDAKAVYPIQPVASAGGAFKVLDEEGFECTGGFGSIGPILTISSPGRPDKVLALTNYHILRRWSPGYTVSPKAERDATKPAGGGRLGLAKANSHVYRMYQCIL